MPLLTAAGVQQFPALSGCHLANEPAASCPISALKPRGVRVFLSHRWGTQVTKLQEKRRLGFLPTAAGKTYLFDGSQRHLKS